MGSYLVLAPTFYRVVTPFGGERWLVVPGVLLAIPLLSYSIRTSSYIAGADHAPHILHLLPVQRVEMVRPGAALTRKEKAGSTHCAYVLSSQNDRATRTLIIPTRNHWTVTCEPEPFPWLYNRVLLAPGRGVD